MTEESFCFRPAVEADIPFIFDATVKSSHDKVPWRFMDRKLWSDIFRPRLRRLLERASVVVVCDPEEPSVVWGFVVFEEGVLHYLYVKQAFRGLGIARALAAEALRGFEGQKMVTALPAPFGGQSTQQFLSKHKLQYDPFKGLLA